MEMHPVAAMAYHWRHHIPSTETGNVAFVASCKHTLLRVVEHSSVEQLQRL